MKISRHLHNSRIPFALASAIAAMFATQAAHAITYYWDNDGTTAGYGSAGGTWASPTVSQWSTSTNGTGTPGASITTTGSDALNFGNGATGLGTGTITVTGTQNAPSLTFATGSGNITLSGGTLSGVNSITVNGPASATISSNISSGSNLTKSGTGTLTLSGANGYSGIFRLSQGTLILDDTGTLGTATLNFFAPNTLALQTTASSTKIMANRIFVGSTTSTVSGGQSFEFTGIVVNRGGNNTLTNNITGAGKTLTMSGTVGLHQSAGPASFTLAGSGTTNITGVIVDNINDGLAVSGPGGNNRLIINTTGAVNLSNTNIYGGTTTITAGTLGVSVLANGGTDSSIGRSSNAAANLVFGAPTATLRYNGSSNVTTNRGFTLSSGAGGGATIESSGSGTLTIDNTVAMAYGTSNETRLLTLGGTNTGANTFSKVIANNGSSATSLTKAGAGRWDISGTNTYTGATNVNAGTLAITGSGSINASSGVTVAAGANFVYNSSDTITNSLSLSGAGILSRAILGGSGTIGAALTLNNLGDTLSPGNSPGIQTFTTAQTWSSFSYDWEVNNFTGTTAGTDFDRLGLNTLDLTGTVGSYILNVLSLTASNVAGNVPNFSEVNRSWTILTSSGGITGFNAANWTINTTGFTDVTTGNWALAQTGNDLVLSYAAVPEPDVAALIGGLGMLVLLRRRR